MRLFVAVLSLVMGVTFASAATSAQAEEKSVQPRVAVTVSAREGLQGDIRAAVVGTLKKYQDLVVTDKDPDFTIEILGLSSADAKIYCDSIITLSAVYLRGTDGFEGHLATTFPSEYLEREGRKIAEKFHLQFFE